MAAANQQLEPADLTEVSSVIGCNCRYASMRHSAR